MAAGDTQITIVGNLVGDPELRYTPTGQAVANFRVASTPRFLDKTTNEWKDGDSLFLSCNVWRQAAENVAESLQRGMRVIVKGGYASGPMRPGRARSAPSTRSRSTRSARRSVTPPPRWSSPTGPAATSPARAAAEAGRVQRRRLPAGRGPVDRESVRRVRRRCARRAAVLTHSRNQSPSPPRGGASIQEHHDGESTHP